MKLRKILKSMFNSIARRSKTYRQAICSDNKKPAPAGFFVS